MFQFWLRLDGKIGTSCELHVLLRTEVTGWGSPLPFEKVKAQILAYVPNL